MTITVHSSLQGGPLDKSALGELALENAFPAEEYHKRLAEVRPAMARAGFDILLAQHPDNVLYLSGYQTFAVLQGETLIVPADGEPLLVVVPTELGSALLHTWLERAYGFAPNRAPGAYLAALLSERGFDSASIGVDMSSIGLTARCLEDLRASLPAARVSDASNLVEAVRAVKSAREIECHRRAAPMTDAGMTAAIESVVEGASDNTVAAAASQAMLLAGSEHTCYAPIVTTGTRSGILHSTHKRFPLARGDNVCIEIGACYQRHSTPLMRTASIGPPSADVQRLADACLRALDYVLDALRPGRTFHEVAEAGWRGMAAAGEDLVCHGCFGYGVGAGFPPSWVDGTGLIMRDQHTPIRAGMVFHHPVALRRLGGHGVMFSETTVVTESGCEPLGNIERKLFVAS